MPRHRTRILSIPGRKPLPSNYTPRWAEIYKQHVAIRAHNAGVRVASGPVLVMVAAYFELPKSRHRVRTPVEENWQTSKPDCDNILKIVCDGLQGVAYPDDAKVASMHCEKIVAPQGHEPFTEVWVLAPFETREQFVQLYAQAFPTDARLHASSG